METGKPSRTAYAAALQRAAHQLADGGRVLTDPLAVKILGQRKKEILRDQHVLGRQVMRHFMAARSRFAEDKLARAYQNGTRQAVVLGAGLDTFAYRNPHPELRVFEVDFPSTQRWKRERLTEAKIKVPESVTYVPIDFEHQSLASELVLDPGPVFFIWLGVVPYLSREAFDATIDYIAARPGNEVVFDYSDPPESMPPARRALHEERAGRVAGIGEPWRTYFVPAELAADLSAKGLTEIEDLGPAKQAARYLNRPDIPANLAGGHIIAARKP
jgi:methyltransferase (TIGR00027 family)